MRQPQLSAPSVSTQPTDSTEEHPHSDAGLLRQPFVQNVLPFVTSLSIHAGILIIGLLVFGAVKLVRMMPKTQIQTVIAETAILNEGPPGGALKAGLTDSFRTSLHDVEPTSASQKWTTAPGSLVDLTPASADAMGAAVFGEGPMKALIQGGPGGGGTGLIGEIGGGPYGPKGAVFGYGGNARRIVYLCDATGSMINKMATLKDELNKSIVSLKPIQSFDIVFFQGVQIETMSPSLVQAIPERKRKAGTYLEGITAQDTTDPLPSMAFALKLKPQLLYFLTDAADFPDPDALLETIKKWNPKNETKINTILFVENKAERDKNAASEGLMKRIASESGGTFRWVEMDSLP